MNANTFKTYVLLAALGGLLVVAGGALWGGSGAVVGLVIGLLFVGASYWFSDKIAVAAAGAKPVTEQQAPQLYRIVRQLTAAAKLPMPRLYVTPDLQPNAFATGRDEEHAAVAVTQGILQLLDEQELRAVLAHELSHVKNRDILIGSVAAAIAMGITFIARMAMWGAMFAGGRDDENQNPIALSRHGAACSTCRCASSDGVVAFTRVRGRPRRSRAGRNRRAACTSAGEAARRRKADPHARRSRAGDDVHRQSLDRAQGQLRETVHDSPPDRGANRAPPRSFSFWWQSPPVFMTQRDESGRSEKF